MHKPNMYLIIESSEMITKINSIYDFTYDEIILLIFSK